MKLQQLLATDTKPFEEQEMIESFLGSLVTDLRYSLDQFFQLVNVTAIAQLAQRAQANKGTLFFSGVGKSGIIAHKIATTISSTGTRALVLAPLDALHGDLGAIFAGDIVIMLSKSGETEELLTLIPALRNKGAEIIAVVSNERSRLGKAADSVILLPLAKEICPFDMSPTTSAVEQLIFGDLLAMAMMRLKKISLHEYILNHPGGRIGKRQLLRVRDLMLSGTKIPFCSPQDRLMDVLVELSNKQCGCVLVVDSDHKLLGIFTDGDLRRSIQKFGTKSLETPMADLMTYSARSIGPDALAFEALDLMEADPQRPITVLVVLEDNKVAGLIKMHDILQAGV